MKLYFAIMGAMFLINCLAFAQDTTLTVTEAGNLGIGTTAPTEKVQIGDFGNGDIYMAIKSIGGNQARNGIKFRNFNDNYGWTLQNDERVGTDGLNFISHFNDATGVSRLFLGKFGGVGIGTTNPTSKLQVQGSLRLEEDGQAVVRFARPNSTVWTVGPQVADDGFVLFANGAAGFVMTANRTTGNVGFGTATPGFPLEMASGAHVTAGGVWTNASSRQYKENITSLTEEEAVSALEMLNPVKYNYISEKDEEYLGFIAEDVPETVAMKDRKSLSPMDIVAVLTKVVQEQQKKIAALEARLDSRR